MKKILLTILSVAALSVGLTGCQSTDRIPVTPSPSIVDTSETPCTAEIPETEQPVQSADETAEPADTAEAESAQERRAAEILSGMTAAEKAGQVILARYPGENALSEALEYSLGGFVMFGADFKNATPQTIAAEIAEIQSRAKLGMIFAADEEGGEVVRISKYPQYRAEPFPAQSDVLAEGLDAVRGESVEISALMKSLGLNMNLAPVCDLPRSETDFIYGRAFSTDVDEVSQAVGAAVGGYSESGLLCALKHFPGYGNNLDTHTGISIDERSIDEFENLDLKPFRAGIAAGAPVVMVSHNIVSCVDDSLPGSLSAKMYAFLREQGFTGAALTDDLSMDAVEEYCGENEAAVTALKAGADLLCCTDYASAAKAVAAAVESGEIPQERIDEAVTRVLMMKLEYGIIE